MAEVPAGIYQFDIEKDPNGPRMPSTNLPGLTEANQHFDDGSQNRSTQITTEVDPWTQNEAAPAAQTPDPVVQPDETARLKKIIGDQGNTIGELRKLMGTLTERLVNNPPQAASQSGASVNLFKSRDPNDYPTAAEVQQALLLAGGELYQAINQKLEEVAMQSQLSQAGVSPEESNLIRLEYPSLAHLPATERNAVIAAIVKVKRTEANQAQAAFATQATQTAQAGVRQQVYVPQPQPSTSVPQSGAVIDLDAFGNIKNSGQMAEQLRKLGIQRVNDIGRRG